MPFVAQAATVRAALLAAVVALLPVHAAAQGSSGAGTAVLPGEWMLPASSGEVWRGIDTAIGRLGLKVVRREDRFGAIVTTLTDVLQATFGPLESAGLPSAPTRSRLEIHLHVMRGLEPARLAIGVVTETDTGVVLTARDRVRHVERRYGNAVLRTRVLRELEAVLGVAGEPLSVTPAGRAAQARRLLPAGLDGGCGVREAAEASKALEIERPPARTSYDIRPMYPRAALEAKAEDTVKVAADLTEHGTLVNLALVGTHTTGDEFARAALGAFELWRFTPPVQAGCPTRVRLTLGSRFRFQ